MANNPLFGGASIQDIRKDIETRTQQPAQQPTQQQSVSQRSIQRGFSSGPSMSNISAGMNTAQPTVPKTAYQQNVSQPVAAQQKPITTIDVMGKMYTTMQKDKNLGLQMQSEFAKLQQNPQSQFYAPYTQPTSMAMKDLSKIGFDTSVLNDDWMDANQGWIRSNLIYNGTTTTPSKPGKKATWDQRAAYDLYQYWQDEEATKKFEQQYEAAKEEVAYWAGRTDLNLSPEQIMERVGWDKYDMLSKADEGQKSGHLVELNRGTDYSHDAFYGVIWAARNGGSTGSVWQDMARSAIGDGNQWKEDPETAAKLNWNDQSTYAPYQVGMTANDVGLYFGVQKMTRADLDEIRRTIDPSDATAMKMYEAAEAAVSNTEHGQSEVKLFQDTLNERLKNCTDPDKAVQEVMKLYNNGVYDKNTKETTSFSMLHKLDDSLKGNPDDLVKTTDAIDWRLEDVKAYARSVAEENSKKKNGSTVISDTSSKIQNDVQASAGNGSEGTGLNIPTPTAAEAEAKKAQDETLSSAASALEDNVTPAEQATIENGWSITYDDVVRMWDGLTATASGMGTQAVGMVKQVAGSLADGVRNQVMNDHMNDTLSSIQTVYDFENNEHEIAVKQAELDQLEKSGVLAYTGMEVRPDMEKEVTIDGTTYMVGLEYVPGADDASGNYQLAYIDELNQYGDRFGVQDMEDWRNLSNNEGVLAAIGEANKEAEKINQAKEYSANASKRDLEKSKRLRQLQLEIEDLKARNAENKGIYEEANAKFEAAQSRREQSLYWMRFLGMDTSDFEKEDYTLQYLADFADYEATAWSRYNPSDAYRIAIAEGHDRNQIYETAKKGNDELSEELQLAKAVRSYIDENNLAVPDNYITNLDRHIAKLERDQKDFEYFALSMNDDFKAVAEKGREIEYKNATTDNLRIPWSQEEYYRRAENPNDESKVFMHYGLRGLTQGLYEQLTEDEKDTYYYLLGKGDKEGAVDYIQSLMDSSYGVLHTRYTEDLKKNAAKMTGSGVLGFVGANILSVLASPISSIASLGYGIYSLATGKELNPDNAILFANNFKTTTRKQSQEEISNLLKDAPPIATSLVQGFYEIVTNRLDSMTNGLAFGGLSSNISNSILNELVGASPMGFSAAMDSMMEVKRNGGSDAQAWTIGLVTFLAETGTEAVSLDNIKDAFGIGKEAAEGGIGAFVKNWLTKAGVSEMLGETATEIIEQKIDEAIMGENSDHNKLVWSYRMEGYGPDDAEAMARRDEIGNILHTALISYLSPGMDIASYAVGRGAYYLEKTRKAQQEGYNTNIFEVYGIERAENKAKQEAENKAVEREPGKINLNAVDEANERHAQRDAEETAQQNGVANGEGSFVFVGGENAVQEEQIDPETFKEIENRYGNRKANDTSAEAAKDYNALETVRSADNSTKTATASHVMNTERTDVSADKATAAAKAFNRALGNDTNMVDFLQDAVIGADVSGTDRGSVMEGVQTAVLGGEDSASFKVMQTEAFKTATPAGKAVMLAQAAEQDRQNKTVQDTIAKNVHDSRVAEAEKPLIANGALDGTKKASDARDSAIADLNTARTELQKKTAEKEAKGQAMANAAAELNQNPSDENRKNMDRALNELSGAITAEDQYAQNVDNMQGKANKAQQDLNDVRDREMTALRQQAEARVAEIDQERAQFTEQQRVLNEAREKAIAKAREDENFSRLNAEEVVDELFPNISEDDRKYALGMVMAVQRATSQDANSWLARGNFAKSFAKKFNLQWQTVQNAPYNARVNPKTGTLEVSSEATQSDIMYAVLIHELTHIAEASDTYGELADAVLQIKYGDGVTYKGILDAMKSGDVSSKLAQDVLGKKSIYDRQLNKNHSNEEMLQEIVADCVGYTIAGDQDAMNKLVAEKPSLARRILDSIKSFLKKVAGIEDETVTQAQRVVDMLENALKEAKNSSGNADTSKYYLAQFSDGKRFVSVEADQNLFDGLSINDMQKLAKEIIRERFQGKTIGIDNKAIVTGRTAKEYSHTYDRNLDQETFESKLRASTEIDNILDAGTYIDHKPDGKDGHYHKDVVNGFDYYRTVFKVGNEYFEGKVNIANTIIGPKFYDVTELKNITQDILSLYGNNPATEFLRNASMENVAHSEETVNPIVTDEQNNVLATELPGGTVSVDTERYSLSSFNSDEQKKVRDALVKSGRFTGAQVDRYMNDALGIASVIAADRGRLDFEASDNQVFLKPNNDYYFTLDASTLCAKRLLYQGTFDYVQHALPDEVFTPEDLIDLVNIMRDMGYETPCGICYVESRRRWLDTYAQKFLDELPDSADAFIEKYFKKATDEEKAEIQEHYTEWNPSIDDLTTSDGLEQLRHNNPYMHKAFVDAMNKKGTANPKVVQLRTEYRGDIRDMKAKDIQKVKDIGGLRIQSFSDFETPHLLDMVQAVLDMSAAGLTSQAYTKVPNFAWVFGDTGIKINLSLIGKGTGLDENGNLVFDDREGMPFEEAMKLRDRYSKNVGTILVGINDDHIIAAMGDPRIDFIIPFHKSGWSAEELRKMPTLNNYNDYTDTQNERVIIGRNKDGSYVTESFKIHKDRTKESLENFQPVGKNGYWDFSKNGQWNAEKYLKMCAEQHRIPKFSQFLVDNGNGTFSLPQGSDKRSTAIREGYWKTLIDFKMYDNNGVGAAQAEVTPNINMAEAYRVLGDYKLGRQMPDKADGTKGRFIPMESNNSVPVAIPAAEEYIELIKRKRGWSKPAAPGPDTLEADLPSDVVNPRASAFGASTAPAILGNTEGETVEANSAGQNAMAIDAETGETVRYSLPAAIDQVYEDMSTDELWELLGLGSEDEEEARNIMTVAVQDIKDEFDPTIYNGKLYVKPETLDHWLSSGGFASSNPKYAQAYITTMNPEDFLRMTTVTEHGQNRILNEATPLDEEKIGETAMRQPIQLSIDEASGKIVGHEGRHRAVALARAGVTEIPVLLFDSATKYSKEAKPELTLRGQDYGENENGNELTFRDVIPLSSGNRDEITQRFTASAEDEASAAENDQRVLRYSLPSGVENAIYVKDGHKENGDTVDFINEMLDGNKKGETRSHKNLTRKQWLGLSKDGQVYGRVRFGEPIQITRESPEYADAMIAGTEYDIKDGESKYYYPIIEMEDFRDDPKPIIQNGNYGQYNFPAPEEINPNFKHPDGTPATNDAVEKSDVGVRYSLRTTEPPKNVIECYKAFYVKDGKLYPPMISNVTNDEDIDRIKGKRTTGTMKGLETPVGVWLDADVGGLAVDESGEPLRTKTTGRLQVRNDKSGGNETLAFRPGWHLGEWPDAHQFYKKDPVTGKPKSLMPDDLVFAKCEIAADIDYQIEALELGVSEKGGFSRTQAGLPRIPKDGFYKYRTNANPEEAPWYISGAMRITEILDDEDCRRICAEYGVTPGERYSHHDIDLEKYGLKKGPVKPTENLERFKKNKASQDNDALLERSLNDERYSNAYVRRNLNFDDPTLLNEFKIDRISDDKVEEYRRNYQMPVQQQNQASTGTNDGKRYSLPSDAPYLSAVNHGNMDEAQRMVDEKAKEAGYDVNYLVWRGDSEPYNVLLKPSEQENYEYADGEYGESGNLGEGLYFTPNRGYAEQFARNGGIVRKFYLKYNAADLSDADVQAELNSILRDVEESGEFASTDEIMDELLTRLDKDAIIGHDVGGFAAGADEIAVQESWQAKLADPVTYDDDGNVIPLSERFNTKNPDIRYNLPSDNYLEGMIRQRLGQDNGLTGMDNLPGMQTTEDGSAQRQFGSRTAQGSDALHQSVKDYLFTHSSYTPESNQEQIDRAMSWVENKKNDSDPDGYHAALSEVLSPNFDYRSADGQARMLTVMGMAALKGDTENELRLADAYNKQGTDLGRQLQARKIFRLMTPVGRMSVLQKMVTDVNDEYGRQGKTTRVGLSDWTLQAAAAAETEEDFAKVRKVAAREIAEQMPANWKDKLRGFRMLSMLGNPRTHIRNIIGNAMFIPAVSLKNKIGAAAEMITGQENRTKTLRPFLSREVRNFAKQDALTMRDALTGEAKYNDDTLVDREKKAFRGILQVLSDFNSNALEAEDWFFLKGHYRRAFGGWMQANGYTAAQLRSDPKLLETGRAYAIQEAQKATYRDFNGLAAKLQELVRNPKTAGQKALAFGVEAALPFKKTPANILKRGIEYSPIGIAKTLVSDAKGLKQYMDYQNGKLKVMPEGAVSPNQFIDNLCAGLTGTGIMAIGALLGSMGAASAGLGDDDDEFEKLKGNQAYAIKFNLFGQDVTFTMDWAAPMSMPFFVGVALQEQLASDGDMSIEDVLNAIGGISEPVFNLSMLDGVNSLFRTSQNDDTNTLTQIGTKIATNYVTSYVPSILGATARTIDSNRRKAYVESGKGTGVMGTVRYAVEQTENKIPRLSQSNIPYRDVFGRTEESGLGERILENFVLPGYVNRYNQDDEVVNELERIGAVPKMPGKTITVKKERIALTDKQWDAYVTARGQTAYNELGRLIETDAYQMADKETKNDMVQKVWSYADQIGKHAAVPEYEVKESDPVQSGINDANKATMIRCLKGGDIEGYETMVEALRDAGVEDQAIKQKIGDTYRDLYKDAYRKEDYAKMDEIENILENTGFVFDIGSWEKAVDKEDVSGRRIDPNLLFAGAGGIPAGLSGRMMRNENTVEGPDGPIQVLGNIDLNNRQVVHNDDGSISTERSLSFYDEDTGKEVLIPTVINGRIVDDDEAIDHYYETGEYLGMFDTPEEADEYAEMLHNRQDWYYNR